MSVLGHARLTASKYLADESATASGTAAAAEAASTPHDSFCQLFGANLSRDTQCLDDWRLQLLELLPAAGIQLTEAQVCKVLTNSSDPSRSLRCSDNNNLQVLLGTY